MPHPATITALLLLGLQSSVRTTADALFPDVGKFEKNAISIVRVESDKNRQDARLTGDGIARFSNVYVFKYEQPGQYNTAEIEPYRRRLHTPEWTCKVCPDRLKPGEVMDACSRPVGPSTFEKAVIDMKPKELVFVHSIGKSSAVQVSCDDE